MPRVAKTTLERRAVAKPTNWKSNSVRQVRAMPRVAMDMYKAAIGVGLAPMSITERSTEKRGSEALIFWSPRKRVER